MVNEETIRELIIKKSRRDLIDALKMWYPSAAPYESLCLTMPGVEERHLRIDLSYLIDKGCVEWTNEGPNMTWAKREFRLTALGVETADRINKDPALTLRTDG